MYKVLYDDLTHTKYFLTKVSNKNHPFVFAPNWQNIGTQSALDIAQEKGFAVAINAGLFNPIYLVPEGIIIQNGSVIQTTPTKFYPGCMPLTIDRDGKLGYAKADADAHKLAANGIVSAVCGFMPIIEDFKRTDQTEWPVVRHFGDVHQRQIIGQFDNGGYAVITCEGRGYADSVGWTIDDAQRICEKHGLKFAYNLDGGTSTETVIDGVQLNSFYKNDRGRLVPTFIIFP